MHSLLTRFLGRTPALPRAAARSAPTVAVGEEGEEGADDAAPGCGWFDSSHELHHGLWVREHASPDEVANDLPLAFWLELHQAYSAGRPAA